MRSGGIGFTGAPAPAQGTLPPTRAVSAAPAAAAGAAHACPPACLPALQSTGKSRIICLTAKRRSKKRGFKGTLHILKLAQGRYQASQPGRAQHATTPAACPVGPQTAQIQGHTHRIDL